MIFTNYSISQFTKRIIFLLFLFCYVGDIKVFAQATWYLAIDGKVEKDAKRLDGAVVTLLKNGSEKEKINTSSTGKFMFKLEPDADYTIKISKPGHVSKLLSVNTRNVPPEEAVKEGYVFPISVTLFEEVANLDVSILNQPIGKLFYSKADQNFDFDEAYTKSMQAQLVELQKQMALKKKEEAERLAEEARRKALEEAKKRAEEEARKKAAADAAAKASADAKLKAAADAKAKSDADAAAKLAADAKAKAEADARKKADSETAAKLAAEQKLAAEAAAKALADAKLKAAADAKAKSDADAAAKLAADAKAKAEADARKKADSEAAAKLSAEEKAKRDAEAKLKVEEDAKNRLLADQKLKEESDAKKKAEAEAAAKAAAEAKLRVEAFAKAKSNAAQKQREDQERMAAEMAAKGNKRNLEVVSEKEKKEKELSELAKKYPEGITIENVDGQNCKIERIIVIKDAMANEYKKIIYNWGGVYYKKNDLDISEHKFTNETK